MEVVSFRRLLSCVSFLCVLTDFILCFTSRIYVYTSLISSIVVCYNIIKLTYFTAGIPVPILPIVTSRPIISNRPSIPLNVNAFLIEHQTRLLPTIVRAYKSYFLTDYY